MLSTLVGLTVQMTGALQRYAKSACQVSISLRHCLVSGHGPSVNAPNSLHTNTNAYGVAGEGERVSFGKNTVKARNSVETWLGSVESAMVSSLRRLAKQGMASYPEEPRPEWVLQQPAQLVIAVSQVFLCGAVEEALKSNIPVQKLADVHEVRTGAAQRGRGVEWLQVGFIPCSTWGGHSAAVTC